MIVTCPQCHARYTVAPHLLQPEGRTLKCNKCANTWHQNPPLGTDPVVEEQGKEPPLPPVNPTTQVSVEQEVAAHTRAAGKQRLVILGVGGAVGLCLLVGAGIFLWPKTSQKVAPIVAETLSAPTVDEKLNVDTPAGFALHKVERQVVAQEGMNILLFKGQLVNTSKLPQPVPEVLVTLLSASGRTVDYWPAQIEADLLEPEQTIAWVCRFFNPPLTEVADYKISIKPQVQ